MISHRGSRATTLFEDNFSAYAPAETIYKVPYRDDLALGPWRVYSLHYMWSSPRFANWTVTGFPWAIVRDGDGSYIEMPDTMMNVVLAAGDEEWRDYTLRIRIAWTGQGSVGALFRYRTSRHNYRLEFAEGQRLRIVRREDDEQVVLAERVFRCSAGEWHDVEIRLRGPSVRAEIDGLLVFDIEDRLHSCGRIGLWAEGTGRFTDVVVEADEPERRDLEYRTALCRTLLAEKSDSYPRCVRKRTIDLPRAFSFVHAADLDGDGRLEFVGFVADVLRDDYTNITGVGVYDIDGRELWYSGRPQTSDRPMHSDVGYQIADLNGDGAAEILYSQDFEMKIASAATGEVLRAAPTPQSIPGCEDVFPRIIGDSFHVCNLRGRGARRDFLVKDRYSNIWAYTTEFEPLWHRQLNAGHYPRAADINGDGRDEVMAGYTMLDSGGRTLWTVPDSDPFHNRYPGTEHADSIWIGQFKEGPDAPVEIAIAASDLGFNLLDRDGRLLARDLCGHAQCMGIAKFRKDIPGRQFLIADFWGNPGLMALFDCHGRRLATRELDCSPEAMPVKWDRTGEVLYYACGPMGGGTGGLYDGHHDRVVEMPAGTGVRPAFQDVDGDGLDEFLFLDGMQIHIWGREEILGTGEAPGDRCVENFSAYGAFFM